MLPTPFGFHGVTMKRLFVLGLGLVLWSGAASAHHSLSAYDRTHYKIVEGTVKSFVWGNPHARLNIVVADAAGTATEWSFEGGGVGRLSGGGFTRDSIGAGDKIKVAYNPMRDGKPGGFFLSVTAPDGKELGRERLQQFKLSE
jgi:hypothetical protein